MPMSPQRKRSAENMPLPAGKRKSGDLRVVEVPELPWHAELPTLPTIDNKVIEKQVFTHPSAHGKGKTAVSFTETGDELEDNEKLEWIGDGILKAVCTRLLHRLWPNMREGPSTTIMSHLVSNTTLAQISQRYGLMKHIRVHASARLSIQLSEKNQANLFESYIAGVYHSFLEPSPSSASGFSASQQTISPPATPVQDSTNGDPANQAKTEGQAYDEVSAWLVPLFTPIAQFLRQHLQAEQERMAHIKTEDGDGDVEPVPEEVVGSSAALNERITRKLGSSPTYVHTQTAGLMWRTECTLDMGDGRVLSASSIQTGKKPGMQVVAHKLLAQLGPLD